MIKDYCLVCGQNLDTDLSKQYKNDFNNAEYLIALLTLLQNKLKDLTQTDMSVLKNET